jgi:P4 family phage/plasmid primase-like protien
MLNTIQINESSKYRYKDISHSDNQDYKNLHDNLRKFIMGRDSDLKSNLCNIHPRSKARYYVPEKEIPKIMDLLDKCRKNNIILNFTEMQTNDIENDIGSGIMYDFDILSEHESDILSDFNTTLLVSVIYNILNEVLEFPDLPKQVHYVMITKKEKPVFKEESNKYKHGFHIIIPNIWILRPVKKYIFNKILESEQLQELFGEIGQNLSNVLDTGSVSVPVHFIGNCKPNSIPYIIDNVFMVEIRNRVLSQSICTINSWQNKFTNITYEFSINYQMPNGVVQKQFYKPKKEYYSEISFYDGANHNVFDPELERIYNDISLKSLYIPDIEYTKTLLSLLSIERLTDRNTWRDVIFALASKGSDMKSLAIWVSKRVSSKYDSYGFEQVWNTAIQYSGENKLTIKSIRYWAKLDSPKEYEQFCMTSICDMIRSDIKDTITFGTMLDNKVAKYLVHLFRNKFVTDIVDKKSVWYEFITEIDEYQQGEIYKWRYLDQNPDSLSKYISDKIPDFIRIILEEINFNIDNCTDDETLVEYLTNLKKRLIFSSKKLYTHSFKQSVLKEAEPLFRQYNFYNSLDREPSIMGVGNGVLEFKDTTKLIQYYHSYNISMFTDTNYIPYDENNRDIQRVYKTLKDLFPEDEMDVFDFLMFYLASSLDGFPKESVIFILTGCGANGKSFLIEFVRATLGSDYVRKLPIQFLLDSRTKATGADPAMMELKNSRLVYYSETNQNEKLNTAKLKEITGQETISSRNLYGSQQNFKPNCNHLVTTNHGFTIETTEHATWRRILTVSFKMVFLEKLKNESKYERQGDPNIIRNFSSNPRNREALLSILVHYRERLYTEYNGNLLRVPKPTIDKETNEYRNKEDLFNRFLDERTYVSTGTIMSMDEISSLYRTWYRSLTGNQYNNSNDVIKTMFLNSKINKFFKKENGIEHLVGLRLLNDMDKPNEDEIMLIHSITRA